jgi:TonB-dependent starch-binding outer membrane protein SusC
MKKLLMFFSLLFIAGYSAMAQTVQISGTVTSSDDGSPLPGVTIFVKGTTLGVLTAADGKYLLSVPVVNKTLVFSYVGYKTQELQIEGKTKIDCILQQDLFQVDEVVVVAYGTQQKRDLSGSVASVKGDAIKSVPVQSFDQALQGKAAGVAITLPNGVLNNPPVIRIRGYNSISGSSFPLVVVDGVPIATGNFGGTASTNALSDINPSDIASMDILKDASATALYGSRAANGVILITTKHGIGGKTKVTYDAYVGYTEPSNIFKVMNAEQYIDEKNAARINMFGPNTALITQLTDASGKPIDTKWSDKVYRKGFQQNHALTISGSTAMTNYFLSIGYADQQGMVRSNNFTRKNARLNIDHKINEYLKIGANIGYTNGYNTSPQVGADYATAASARLAFVIPPVLPIYNNDGTFNIYQAGIGGQGEPFGNLGYPNPVVVLKENVFTSETDRLLTTLYATLSPFKGLVLKTQYGIDDLTSQTTFYYSPINGDGQATNGDVGGQIRKFRRWNWSNTATYTATLAEKFNIGLLAGIEEQRTVDNASSYEKYNVNDPFFKSYQGSWTNVQMGGGSMGENYYISYFGRANFNFDKKYFIEGSVRRDGFSGLAAGKKFGTFFGASAMWNVSNEKFISDNIGSLFSDVRLKASFGRVGNISAVDDFSSLFLYGSGLYASTPTLAFSQAGNADLKWETSDKYDAGLSFSLLKDRIQAEINYYYNNINGLVLKVPQAPSKGIPGDGGRIPANVGSMYNTGAEITITSYNISKPNFSWSTTLNFSTLKNRVTALAPGVTELLGYTGSLEITNKTVVGKPIGGLFVVETHGVDPETGRRIFVNAAGQEVEFYYEKSGPARWQYRDGSGNAPAISQSADGKIMGSGIPTVYGGIDNNLAYKNFDFSIGLTYALGFELYNGSKAGLRDQRWWNNSVEVAETYWKNPGDVTDIAKPFWGDNLSNGHNSLPQSSCIEKGDYMKIRNLSIGYTFKKLPSVTNISSIRVYAQAFNLHTFTKYTGSDPEVSSVVESDSQYRNLAPGTDRNSAPQARTYTFGVSINF